MIKQTDDQSVRHSIEEDRPIYKMDNSNLPDFVKHNAVASIQFIPIEKVQANDYNPNAVATHEMRLLYISVSADTYTMPVVTIYDPEIKKYVIIDGFHRYSTMRRNKDIYEMNEGYLPCVVLEKDINERMASTVRHNRARGKHSVNGMSHIVFEMLKNGRSDVDICNELGLEKEELLRLKHITGFSKLFANVEYSKAWNAESQLKVKAKYKKENPDEEIKV